MTKCTFGCQAHNAGKRCRATTSKLKSKRGSNVLARLEELRAVKKKVLKHKSRRLHVRNPMKIYTVERFLSNFKCIPEKKGLVPSWHAVPGGTIWGVRCRALPDGEYDAEDSQADGVSEVEEIDSGDDVVRADQQERKFNALSDQLGQCSSAAVHIAAALADSDHERGAGTDDEPDEAGSQDSDIVSCDVGDYKPNLFFNALGRKATF